jgi:uncharacterized integral membrane protein
MPAGYHRQMATAPPGPPEPADSSADAPPPIASAAVGTGEPAGSEIEHDLEEIEGKVRRTRVSAAFVGLISSLVVLVLLLIFILDNEHDVKVSYFGATGHLPLGVALLFAAIGGAVLVATIAVARLAQLRLNARRRRRTGTRARRARQRHATSSS